MQLLAGLFYSSVVLTKTLNCHESHRSLSKASGHRRHSFDFFSEFVFCDTVYLFAEKFYFERKSVL